MNATVSDLNSTDVPLGSDEVFTGTSEDVSLYNYAVITVYSDKDSSAGGLQVKSSTNNANFDIIYTYTYTASTKFCINVPITQKYLQVVYTNTSSDQTIFRLQTILSIEYRDVSREVSLPNYTLDAFGRFKTVNPQTLIDVTHTRNKNTLLVTESTSGGATSTYESNTSSVLLETDGNSQVAIRQTRRYLIYQPGKTLVIYCTGVLNAGSGGNQSNVTTRIGYFDDDNGVYFQYDGTNLSVTLRSKSSGSTINTTVNQSAWNIDKMGYDSTLSQSGYILDVTKVQIFVFEIQWLGVGSVRCGVMHKNRIYFVHEFLHDNIQSTTYMTSANLPVRYEIRTNGVNGDGQLRQICSSVVCEGGYEPIGYNFSVNSGVDGDSKSVADTELPILAIRLKSGERANIIPTKLSLLNIKNGDMNYKIRYFPDASTDVLTDESWTSVNDLSAVEYDISATAIDVGETNVILEQGYSSRDLNELSINLTSGVQIGTDLSGNRDIIVLTAVRSRRSGTESIFGSISWRELY